MARRSRSAGLEPEASPVRAARGPGAVRPVEEAAPGKRGVPAPGEAGSPHGLVEGRPLHEEVRLPTQRAPAHPLLQALLRLEAVPGGPGLWGEAASALVECLGLEAAGFGERRPDGAVGWLALHAPARPGGAAVSRADLDAAADAALRGGERVAASLNPGSPALQVTLLPVREAGRVRAVMLAVGAAPSVSAAAADLEAFACLVGTIHARHRAEEDLRRRERFLAAIFNHIPDMVFVKDASELRFVDVNRAGEALIGLPREELLGRTDAEVFHSDEAASFVAKDREVLRSGQMVEVAEETLHTRSRGTRVLHTREIPIVDEDGTPLFLVGVSEDITDRLASAAALRSSEERYRHVFETAPLGIFQTTLDGAFIDVNPASAHLFGYDSPAQMMREAADIPARIYADPAQRREIVAAALGIPGYVRREVQHLRRDGTLFTVNLFLRAVRAPDGAIRFLEGFSEDIDERKRAERALVEAEERYRGIVDNMQEALFRTELGGRIGLANRAAAALFGLERADELVGADIRSLWADPAERAEMLRALRARGELRGYRMRFRRRDGTLRMVDASVRLLPVVAGEPQLLESLLRDVTEQARADEELRRSEQQLRLHFERSPLGAIEWDGELRVVRWNPSAERIFGYPEGEALGRLPGFLVPPGAEEQLAATWAALRASGGGSSTHENLTRDGRTVTCTWWDTALTTGDGKVLGFLSLVEDVTARRQTEEALARAQKLESISVLAGGIAHDFNNLLAGILGNVSYLREQLPLGELGEALEEAEHAALRARELTQQLLTFSRGGAPVKRLLDLGPLVTETARFALRGSAAACRLDVEPGLYADADEGQMAQVIQNLVLNAAQAMPAGGTVTVRAGRVSAAGGGPGGWIRIAVEDQGLGIPRDVLPRIFDPFFTTKPAGKGLGLAICHSIVLRHGGGIQATSTGGKGSSFVVTIPAAGAPEGEGAVPPAAAEAPRGGQRILVMDDERLVRQLLARMLARLGCEAVGAQDGAEAIRLYQEARAAGRPFAAVIMDLTVPGGMGGCEAMARLREIDPGVRAVVSSGYSNDPVVASYADHGFRAVLAKPYQAADLRSALARALA